MDSKNKNITQKPKLKTIPVNSRISKKTNSSTATSSTKIKNVQVVTKQINLIGSQIQDNDMRSSSKKVLSRDNSLNCFPKVDPEFFDEKKKFELWKSPSSAKLFSSKSQSSLGYQKNFATSNIFPSSAKKNLGKDNKEKKNGFVVNKEPKVKIISINTQRLRDFHSNDNFEKMTKKAQAAPQNIRPIKTISPMHYKLYESSLQYDTNIKKKAVPTTHPAFKKEAPQKEVTHAQKKRLDLLRTSYNFMKNYK